jgi:drug/metabolite transporter (DMT)-like permease
VSPAPQTTDALRRERLGLAFAALCALDGAFNASLSKLNTGLADAAFVAAAITVFGAVCSTAQLAWRGELGLLVRRDLAPGLIGIGLLGTAVAFLLFFEGSQRSTGIETALCIQTEPTYALLLAWVALGQRPTLTRIAASLAIVTGIGIAVGLEQARGSAGVWLLLATPLAWQLSHLIALRGLRGVNPRLLTAARYVYGSLFLVAFWLLRGGLERWPAAEVWPRLLPMLAVQGIVIAWGGTLLWYNAITRLDLPRTTSIVVPSILILSFGATFLVLGEVPTPREWLGLAITALGVLTYVRSSDAPRPTRDASPALARDAA